MSQMPKKRIDSALDLKSWSKAATFICQYGKKDLLVSPEAPPIKPGNHFWFQELDFEDSKDIAGVHFIGS